MERHPVFTENLIFLKSHYYLKQSIQSMQSYQNYNYIFHRNGKMIFDFIWKCKRLGIIKTIFKKKDKTEEFTFAGSQTYCKSTVIKRVWQ